MPKGKKKVKKFYAVANGRKIGIYDTWEECQVQINLFKQARFKSFLTYDEAQEFINNYNIEKEERKKAAANNAQQQQQSSGEKRTTAADSTTTTSNSNNTNKRIRKPKCDITVHIMFDGGSRGNPGIAGAGAVVTISNNSKTNNNERIVYKIRDYLGRNYTNNQAEYTGLVTALKVAKKQLTDNNNDDDDDNNNKSTISLIVQGDSNLIIKQLNNEYKCKNKNLIPLYKQAKELIFNETDNMYTITELEHVYRNDNTQADALANEAMDAQRSWVTTSNDNHTEQHTLDSFVDTTDNEEDDTTEDDEDEDDDE